MRASLLFLLVFSAVLLACTPRPGAFASLKTPFIEDDYARAVEEARQKKRLLFVDVWASWCEPCMETKKSFHDPSVEALAGDFVWLAIDHDRDTNTRFLHDYPSPTLPMLWVIDVATSRVILKWNRGASPQTLRALLLASRDVARMGLTDENAVLVRWSSALDQAAEDASTAGERVAFDANRLDAYVALGAPERAIPMLERSAREFSEWYQPWMRLARVHLLLGRIDEAATNATRARALVSGVRSAEVLEVVADVAAARGDRAAERQALGEALVVLSQHRIGTESRRLRDTLKKRLAALP